MAEQTVTLRINADGKVAVKAVSEISNATRQMGTEAQQGGTRAAQGIDIASRSAQKLAGDAASARASLLGLLAAAGGAAVLVRSAAAAADAYTNLTGKIRNVTASEAELNMVRERTFAIAQQTRSDYESTVELYTRLTRATASLGISQSDTLRITETINKAFVVSNASASEASNAIVQLAQGLSAGALRGDEFNSVSEQAPILMDLLGKSLNMTRGELRAYAADGKITAEVVTTALLQGSASVDAQFGKMGLTIGGATVQLKNAAIAIVGSASEASGGAQALAGAISLLASHLDLLLTAAVMVASVMGARFVASTAGAILLANAQRAVAATALAEAEAQVAKARVMAPLIGTTNALAAAELRLAEAQAAATAAGVGKAGMLARMGSSLLALVGGPIGLTLLAIGGLVIGIKALIDAEREREAAWRKGLEQSAAEVEDLRARVQSLNDEYAKAGQFTGGSLGNVLDVQTEAEAMLAEKRAELAQKTDALRMAEDAYALASQRAMYASEGGALAAASAASKQADQVAHLRAETEAAQKAVNDLTGPTATLTANLSAGAPAVAAFADMMNRLKAAASGDWSGLINLPNALDALRGGITLMADNKLGPILAAQEKQFDAAKKKIDEYTQGTKAYRLEQQAQALSLTALKENGEAEVATLRARFAEINKAIDQSANLGKAEKDAAQAARELVNERKQQLKQGDDYVKNLQDLVTSYGLAGAALERYRAAKQGLTPGQLADANEAIAQKEALDAQAAENNEAAAALESLRGMQSGLADEVEDLRAKLGGASAAQLAFNATQRDAAKAYAIAAKNMDPSAADAYAKAMAAAKEKLDLTGEFDASAESMARLQDILGQLDDSSPFEKMSGDLRFLESALDDALGAGAEEKVKILTAAIDAMNAKIGKEVVGSFGKAADATAQVLTSIQSTVAQGSREYEALAIAIDVANLAAGIAAIVNQGTGDPYTAIPRMIAMAALVSKIVDGIGSFAGGGFSDTAAKRQESQGTGSVLGDASAKSESIERAIEITADATSELVGINRGMLRALLALQAGIGSAATMLARGAGDADFSGMNLAVGQNSLNSFFDGAGILGGKSKITDQGIVIFGGALNDLLEKISIGAYQEVQSRSWAFGSTHTREGITDVSDEFGAQFQLIIKSIADTVREGALALGLLPADIDAAMAAYKIEETRISLKGLSAEEQEAELKAVFGKIFDGLAGSVVPFLPQFQRVGEGLGETLVRVATGVQVTQEGVRQLGFALDETDPERFAQISESLLEMTGGIEGFISGMTSFVSAFAPEAHKFEVASTALTSAFAQAGLTVPATAEGMWDLMQSLDATTEEGREQIATLLRLSGVAKEYYDLLEKKVTDATKYLEELGLSDVDMSDFTREIMEIHASGEKAAEAANTLANAQGRAGASTLQMARIRQWTLDQEAAAIRRLNVQMQDLIAQLYGGIPGSLDAINTRIGELESAGGGAVDAIGEVENASAQLFESWANGVQTVQQYLDSMLLGELSNLKPEEQLAEAQRQLMEMQARAVGGDAEALSQLPQMADAYLSLLKKSGASGDDFNTGVDWVRQLLKSVVDMQNPGTQSGAGAQGPVELVPSAELRELYAARDVAQAEQDKAQRAEWARLLLQNLADMATLMKIPTLTFIEAQGLALLDLAADLGVDLENLTASSVSALGFMASTLGVSMTELTNNLGISLVDLRGGLTEMTGKLGIDLSSMTVGTTQTLAALAASLGMDLSEMEESLGISLGSLRDKDSLVNRALGAEIGTLPKEQRDALEPLLTAITTATSEADANEAIAQLEAAVNGMGGATANALAPYLAGVMPVSALNQLDYLSDLQELASKQLDVLELIRDNLKAANIAAGAPSYAVGTGYVPRDGLAMIHEGEAIIPAPFAAWMRSNGLPVARGGGGSDERVVVELRSIRERLESLERTNSAGHSKTAQNVSDGDSKARTQREDISLRKQDTSRSRSA